MARVFDAGIQSLEDDFVKEGGQLCMEGLVKVF